ncbi:MAG TPA: 2-dehydropantoate 2-reductase [Mycobacterium sp.]|nr:2-dehydropantoate 2-reductase [Mycobacterium sp.]
MTALIVGAGATGGYIGERLIAAGRDVTFLVHQRTLARLTANGLRLRHGRDIDATDVKALTAAELNATYDVIVVAVRTGAVESAIDDFGSAVGEVTTVVPIMNGMRHLSEVTAAFGPQRVLGAATRLVASMSADGTIEVVVPGIDMQIGLLDGGDRDALEATRAELAVPDISVKIRDNVVGAMWEKFAFITSTAVLTCLVGDEIGPIARADGGIDLGRRVLAEVSSIAAAEGYPLTGAARTGMDAMLTDPSSAFGPSMFRDMRAGRPIEIAVLEDLAARARTHHLDTPLLDASMVVIDVHNRRA